MIDTPQFSKNLRHCLSDVCQLEWVRTTYETRLLEVNKLSLKEIYDKTRYIITCNKQYTVEGGITAKRPVTVPAFPKHAPPGEGSK